MIKKTRVQIWLKSYKNYSILCKDLLILRATLITSGMLAAVGILGTGSQGLIFMMHI
jgi:hypothetical protein